MADPFWSSVSLLLHFNGADEGTTATDNSPNAHTMTRVGSANTEQSDKKWGSASGEFAWGTGSAFTAPNHASFDLGTGDFTIELWAKPDGTAGGNASVLRRDDGSHMAGFLIYHISASGNLRYYASSTGASWDVASDLAIGTLTGGWDHVAITRSGTTFSLYINGVRTTTFTSSSTLAGSADAVHVGGTGSSGCGLRLDDVRITKGVARYTGASYTVPTAEFDDSDVAPGQGNAALEAMTAAASTQYGAPSFSPMTAFAAGPPSAAVTMEAMTGSACAVGGTPSLAALTSVGVSDQDDFGSASFEAMTAEGVGQTGSTASANYTDLRALTGTGEGSAGSVSEAAVELEEMTAAAYGPMSTDIALEAMTASGIGLTGGVSAGSPYFEPMRGAGVAVSAGISSGTGRLAYLTATGRSAQTALSNGAGTLGRMYAQATGLVGSVAAGAPRLLRMTAAGSGYQVAIAAGDAQFERLAAAGRASAVLLDAARRTWVLETGNDALTEYQNYDFDALTEFGGLYYGAGPGGIMRLDGSTDNGDDIAWSFSTGLMDGSNASREQRGGLSVADAARLKRLEEVLLAMRYDGPVRVRAYVDDAVSFEYNISNFRPGVLHQVRAKLGKGLESRFYRIEMSGIGNVAMDLGSMQLPFRPVSRRIG